VLNIDVYPEHAGEKRIKNVNKGEISISPEVIDAT
jgi:hypothetical protein